SSEPVEVSYEYWGHGGISDVAKIGFDLNQAEEIKRITIKNQTVEDEIEKLLEGKNFTEQKTYADKTDKYTNPDASISMVIDPKDNRNRYFYVSYFLARGINGGLKGRNLMVVSGENELLITVEFSDDHSLSRIEKLDIRAEMHY
ncbi:MAG: hypothetical protein NTY22_07950, partial [Proteobacteria bacterium]|nr:hypothetical protein [Pseudomonadota bacterium]